jgi:hypothetical protein
VNQSDKDGFYFELPAVMPCCCRMPNLALRLGRASWIWRGTRAMFATLEVYVSKQLKFYFYYYFYF